MSVVFAGQVLKITWTCKDAGTGLAIDLTGETVKILTRSPVGVETSVAATMEEAVAGRVSYTFAVDTLTPGEWAAKPYLDTTKTPGTVYRFDVSDKWQR